MRTRGFLSGVAVGAGLVYFLDPEKGEVRRSRARERIEQALDEVMGGEPDAGPAPDRTERLRLRREAAITQRYGSRLGDITGLEAANLRGSPGPRSRGASDVVVGIAGGMMALYGLTRRGPLAAALRAVGAGLLASSVREARPRIGPARHDRRRTVDIQKTIHIEAPVEQVYAFWTNYQNFPLFMSNIREIHDLGGGRSHWLVSGPGGAPIEWDAALTEQVPNERIAWRSEPGSMLDNAGVIRFRPETNGTRVDLRFCYNPPIGGAGQAVAELLGADPRAKLNEDLGRLKALLEGTVRSDSHGQEPGSRVRDHDRG
jgi:uncharacterized membrane protein